MNEFEDDPILSAEFINEVRTTQPESSLARAYQAFDDGRFTDIPSLCTQELQVADGSLYELQSLLLRGSIYLLMGNYAEAVADFDAVAQSHNATQKVSEVNSCIPYENIPFQMKINAELKRANTKIHQRDIEGAMYEYDQCVLNHPNQCGPRVHRGMVWTQSSLCSSFLSFNLVENFD